MKTLAVTAVESFEVEVDLSGTFVPGRPATPPSYASGGDPPEPDGWDDVAANGLFGLRLRPAPEHERGSHPRGVWTRIDLLAGLDPAARAQVAANVLACLGQREAEDALYANLPDDGPDPDDERDRRIDDEREQADV